MVTVPAAGAFKMKRAIDEMGQALRLATVAHEVLNSLLYESDC